MDPQVEIMKQMTPQQKLEISMGLYWSARRLKAAAIRQHHPDWTDEQVEQAVKEVFFYARS